jgi:hypothetical protein
MPREMSPADEAFYAEWHPRLIASHSRSQRYQDALMDRFFAACREREGVRLHAVVLEKAALKRARNATRMRLFRARQRAAKERTAEGGKR